MTKDFFKFHVKFESLPSLFVIECTGLFSYSLS